MKILLFLFLLFLVSCNKDNRHVIQTDKFQKADTTSFYSVLYDKDGKVIDEHKSEGYKENESNFQAAIKNAHLYEVLEFKKIGQQDSKSVTIKGKIVSSENVVLPKDFELSLVGELEIFNSKLSNANEFEFENIQPYSHHLFVQSGEERTIVKRLDLEKGFVYNLIIKVKK